MIKNYYFSIKNRKKEDYSKKADQKIGFWIKNIRDIINTNLRVFYSS